MRRYLHHFVGAGFAVLAYGLVQLAGLDEIFFLPLIFLGAVIGTQLGKLAMKRLPGPPTPPAPPRGRESGRKETSRR